MKRLFLQMILGITSVLCLNAQTKSLHQLQQEFVDLRCGMFIHFNMPTFFNEDWPDPDAAPELFNPVRMDCKQWAKAAKSANMTYGCLTTKHHSGFCIWDTKTTDYSVMSSPFKRDVVKRICRRIPCRRDESDALLFDPRYACPPASQVYNSAAYRNDQGATSRTVDQLW